MKPHIEIPSGLGVRSTGIEFGEDFGDHHDQINETGDSDNVDKQVDRRFVNLVIRDAPQDKHRQYEKGWS